MNAPLAKWIRDKAPRADDVLAPEEALLAGRFARYAARRLLGFGLTRAVAIFFHIVELTVLAEIFSKRAFVAALAMQNAMLVLEAFFWGALEAMRKRARELGPRSESTALVTRWLTLACHVAFVAVLLPVGYAVYEGLGNRREATLLHVYAIVCGLRLALEIVLRTYHSGVFAHMRVYRPLWSLVIGPVLLVSITVVLWDALLGYAFPIAMIVAASVSRALLFVYARRAYVRHRVPRPSFRLTRGPLGAGQVKAALLAGSANAASRLGGVVLLAAVIPSLLVLDPEEGGGLEPFAFALHLAAPFLFLASQWSFVFYHDHKRVESEEAATLARHLHLRLVVLAIIVGAVAWALTAAMVLAFFRWEEVRDVMFALLPLTTGLAVFTAMQLRGFTRGDFVTQGVSAAALIATLVFVVGTNPDNRVTWYLALAAGPWAATILHVMVDFFRRSHARGVVGTHAVFSRALEATQDSVVWRATCRAHTAEVASAIADALGDRGAVFRRGDRIVWFERAPHTKRAKWIERGGGYLVTLERDPEPMRSTLPDLETLRAAHARLFPAGFVVRVGRSPPRAFTELPPRLRQEIWREGIRAARGAPSRIRFAVTAYAPRGAVDALFVTPKPVDPARIEQWRAAMRE